MISYDKTSENLYSANTISLNKWNTYLLGLIFLLSLLLSLGFSSTSNAASGHGEKPHGKSMKGEHHQAKGGKHSKKSSHGGTFTSHWAKTLSDEQKTSFDKMHLMVGQYEAVERAKMKMLKAELNVLAAKDPNNQSKIYKKIDEILAVKKGIMRNRFNHIAEMRSELTEQQRISYDMGLLKRGKHKH